MTIEGKIKFLSENLDNQVDFFNKGRANNKMKAFLLKMLATSFSAATTILLGLQGLDGAKFLNLDAPIFVKNVALTLSALVTLFNAWDAFFNHRALWINLTNSANQLRNIKAELQYLTAGGNENLKEDEIDRIFKKYQSAMNSTNQQWTKLRDDGSNQSE